MPDVDDALAATAVALNEDAKAKRRTKSKALPPADEASDEVQTSDGTGEQMEPLPAGDDAVIEAAPGELNAALESYGEAVRDKQGGTAGYDLSEKAHETAIDRMENLATDYEIDSRSLVPDVRDFLLDQIKARPKPWSATSNGEQRDVAAACEHAAVEIVRKIVEAVASSGKNDPIRCLLVGYADKGDDIKVDLKVKALSTEETTEAVLGLHKAKGKHVLLTVASVDDYRGDGTREAELDPDEPTMNFEAGGPEAEAPPADDSDLVDAAEERGLDSETHPLSTGQTVYLEAEGNVEVRVNVETGMVEGKARGRDEFDIDVRAATPEELASERERTQDTFE